MATNTPTNSGDAPAGPAPQPTRIPSIRLTFALPMTISIPANIVSLAAQPPAQPTETRQDASQPVGTTPTDAAPEQNGDQPSAASSPSSSSTDNSTSTSTSSTPQLQFTFFIQMPFPVAGGAVPLMGGVPSPLDGSSGFSLNDFLNYTFQLQQQQRAGPPPASKSAVERLEEVKVTEAHIKAQALCSVCQEAFGQGDSALGLPCDHLYHRDCITPWLKEHNTCPMCRYELPTDDAEYERGRVQRMQKRDEAKRQRERKCELGRMRNEDCVLLHHHHHHHSGSHEHVDGVEDEEALFATLECGHTFHAECLDGWRNVAGPDRCPSCRKRVTFPEPLASEPVNVHKKRRVDGSDDKGLADDCGNAMEVEPSGQAAIPSVTVVGIKDDVELTVSPAGVSVLASPQSAGPHSQADTPVDEAAAPSAPQEGSC